MTRPSRADDPRRGTSAINAALNGGDEIRLLLDHIADAVFATDTANRFTQWTESAERMFGYSATEALGRSFEELLPYRLEPTGDGDDLLTALEAGRTWRGTGTVRVRDGREIWIESTVEPIIEGGRLLGSVSVARDVTATVEARQKLADEERFVEAVLGATEALVIALDPTGRVERFNAACERLSGYSTQEIVGRVFWDLLHQSPEVEAVWAEFDNLRAGAFPNSFENHLLTATGELRLISWENTCLTDDAGAVTHVIATGIDITERRRVEEELAGELGLMHVLMENVPAQVYFKDRESRFIRISNNGARTLGLSDPRQAVGKTDFDFFTDEHAQQAYEDEREIIRTGQAYSSEERETRTGLPDRWVLTTKLPLRDADERIVGTFGISVDITDRRNAEEALRERERFVEAVLGATEAVVIVIDPEGRVVRVNQACERLSGYPPAEVLGRPFWDVLFPSDEVEQVRSELADLDAAAFPNTSESHWVTVTGELRLIRWENTCLTDDEGAVTYVIATGIDITEARRGDDALQGIEVVGRLLAEQGPVASVLDAVLGELETRMGYRFVSLYLVDGAGLRLGAQRGYTAAPERLDVTSGVLGRVYRSGIAELVRNVNSDPDYVSGNEGVVSEIAAPLLGDGTVLGVLNIEALRPERLTPDDLRLARAIADRLSSALLHNHAQQALSDRVRLFAGLAEFAVAMNAIREPGRLAEALVDAVIAVVPSDTVVVATLDRSDGRYRVSAVRGFAPGAMGAIIEPGDGTVGRAISRRALILNEHGPGARSSAALRDYRQRATQWAVGVPLINEGSVLGVISLGRSTAFTQAEREVLALLGSHAALAFANASLVEEVSALAILDGLTGLYNRRHFDAELDHAIARFKRRAPAGNLGAIMFDLDHFGEFNRRHGHLAGDAVLRLFAGVLHERLRSADLVARYGGEEFVVVLEDCDLPEVVRVAEEVRGGLEAGQVLGAAGQPLHATVSAGCAVIDPADPTKEALIGRADAALFKAKRAGRNQVVAA